METCQSTYGNGYTKIILDQATLKVSILCGTFTDSSITSGSTLSVGTRYTLKGHGQYSYDPYFTINNANCTSFGTTYGYYASNTYVSFIFLK